MSLFLLFGVTATAQAEPLESMRDDSNPASSSSERTRATFTFRNGESHTHTVERIDDFAVAGGDMILGTADQLFSQPGKRQVNGLSNTAYGRTWPNGVVPFNINADLSSSVIEKIRFAVDHWNSIGTITLVERTSTNAADYTDYIDFVDANRCASWIGYQATGPQQIYTGDKCSAGSMIHEIGHALGLLHEHTRPDRDNFVKIHWDRIENNMELNFEIISGGVALGAYDYASIMHYGPTFFTNNGRPTIEPTQATTAEIGQRVATSPGDKQSVTDLYKSNLSLVTSASAQTVTAGDTVDIAMFVTNNSSVGANTLRVVMPVPAVATLLSYSAAHWSCSQNATGADIVCDSAVLAGGADTSLSVSISTADSAGQLFLDATLTSRTLDTNTSDNHDSAVVTVVGTTGDAPVFAAASAQPATNDFTASKNRTPLSGGSAGGGGAFHWLSLSFLLVLFPFVRFRRNLAFSNPHSPR